MLKSGRNQAPPHARPLLLVWPVVAVVGFFVVTTVLDLFADAQVRRIGHWIALSLFAVSAGVGLWRARQLKRRLDAAGGALCPRCGYHLRGLDDLPDGLGCCPECGRRFNLAEDIPWWRRHVEFVRRRSDRPD